MNDIKRLTNKMIESIKTNNNIDECLQMIKYASVKAWECVNYDGMTCNSPRVERYQVAWENACKQLISNMNLQNLNASTFEALLKNNEDFGLCYGIGTDYWGDNKIVKPTTWGDILA